MNDRFDLCERPAEFLDEMRRLVDIDPESAAIMAGQHSGYRHSDHHISSMHGREVLGIYWGLWSDAMQKWESEIKRIEADLSTG